MRGVDFSQYGGDLSPDTVREWRAQQVEFAIVQYSAYMPQQLGALKSGGLRAEAYVYLYWGLSPWGQTPLERVQECARYMRVSYGSCPMLWLDCEDSTHAFEPEQLQACINYCAFQGIPCGIYTAGWWWRPQTGNSARWSHLPLWDAYYLVDNVSPAQMQYEPSSLDNWRPYPSTNALGPYGGWQAPHTWQWHNTTTYCGHSVDMNVRTNQLENGVEDDMWIPSVSLASPPATVGAVLRSQFSSVPASAVRLRIEVFIARGELWLLHGDNTYAGRVGWNGQNYGVIDVVLSNKGEFYLTAEAPIAIGNLGVLAYSDT